MKKEKDFSNIKCFNYKKRVITPISILKPKKRVKKQMSVLANSLLVIAAKKMATETIETIETTETIKTIENTGIVKDDKSGKYLRTNLAQVLYIQYFIIF